MPKPAQQTQSALILSDPLKTHFALKERGSDFSKIARAVSKDEPAITSSVVRAVVYGISMRHRDVILKEIGRVLTKMPPRMR